MHGLCIPSASSLRLKPATRLRLWMVLHSQDCNPCIFMWFLWMRSIYYRTTHMVIRASQLLWINSLQGRDFSKELFVWDSAVEMDIWHHLARIMLYVWHILTPRKASFCTNTDTYLGLHSHLRPIFMPPLAALTGSWGSWQQKGDQESTRIGHGDVGPPMIDLETDRINLTRGVVDFLGGTILADTNITRYGGYAVCRHRHGLSLGKWRLWIRRSSSQPLESQR